MTQLSADQVKRVAAIALLCEAYAAFGMFFQPSWSKGWPGVQQETALAIGFSAMVFLIVLTTACLIAAAVFRSLPPYSRARKRQVVTLVVALAIVLAGLAAVGFYLLTGHGFELLGNTPPST